MPTIYVTLNASNQIEYNPAQFSDVKLIVAKALATGMPTASIHCLDW